MTVEDLGIDVTPRVEVVQVEDPPVRAEGKKLESVEEVIEPLKKLGFF